MNNKTQTIILAAGKGTRMGGGIPKALTQLGDRSMLEHVLDTHETVFTDKPIVVVGYKSEMINDVLGDRALYAMQDEQKGTGHAAMSAADYIPQDAEGLLVLYADQPFVSAETMTKLSSHQAHVKAPVVIATAKIQDNELFEKQFYGFGRIVRNEKGQIEKIVESKDATEEELAIREVNPAYFCLDRAWAMEQLATLKNDNAQGEYYLTDLVQKAFDQDITIHSISIDEREALGANTPEQLAVLESFLKK